jgi:fatty-acyl-CoA synthase
VSAPSVLGAVALAGKIRPYEPSLLLYAPDGWRQVSCGELDEAVLHWAAIFQRFRPADGRPGSAVAVITVKHGLDAYAAFLGAMRVGLVACFIPRPSPKQDPDYYWASHREVFARIRPAFVLAHGDLHDNLRAVLDGSVPLVDADHPPAPDPRPLPELSAVDGDEVPALLQHSSGTTGLKKGVVLTHGQLRRQVDAYAAALSMTRDDTVASWLPLYHDMGLITGFLMPLSLGSVLVAMDPFDWLVKPDLILSAIARFRAAFCWLPNFAFAHLGNTADDNADYDLSSVRAFVDCSEPCRADTLETFRARFSRHGLTPGAVTACYAMAETVFAVSQSAPGASPQILTVDADRLSMASEVRLLPDGTHGAARLVSCGRPLAGTSVRIVPIANPRRSILTALRGSLTKALSPILQVGEIEVLSSSAFDGYHGDPAASAACMDGPWYKTGDLGFLHDGELYVSGRLKDLIIVNGRNFYAHDIEAVASSVPGVKPGRAVAFAVERMADGSDGAVVLAEPVIDGSDDRELARAVGRAVFDTLGLTLHQVVIRPPGMLIKTTSGKLCRKENGLRYKEEITA